MSIVVSVALIFGMVIPMVKYSQIGNLCLLIESGQTELASKRIQELSSVNTYSAPIWIRPLYNMMEADIKLPLVTACDVGDAELVKLLLENGADPNRFLKGNWSPIEVLFERRHKNRFEIAELLVKHGAEVDLYGSYHTALFAELSRYVYASDNCTEEERKYSMKCVRYLQENGANPINEDKSTIIHYLAASGDKDALNEFSVNYKEFVSYQDHSGKTPLIWATQNERAECVRFLVDNGAKLNTIDHKGMTALDYATETGNEEIIDLLS